MQESIDFFNNKYGEQPPKTIAEIVEIKPYEINWYPFFWDGYNQSISIIQETVSQEIITVKHKKLSTMHRIGREVLKLFPYFIVKNRIKKLESISVETNTEKSIEQPNTWQGTFEYNPDMKLRYENMLKLLPPNHSYDSVLDLGCGVQYLKEFVGGVAYAGVDLHKHKEDNIVCDFNKKEFVQNKADLVVAAGVFEYIYDLKWFINHVCEASNKYVLCSYNFKEFTGAFNTIWVNSLTQTEMFGMFFQNDFKLVAYAPDPINPIPNTTGYFCFERKI
jgi:hypothetical protein